VRTQHRFSVPARPRCRLYSGPDPIKHHPRHPWGGALHLISGRLSELIYNRSIDRPAVYLARSDARNQSHPPGRLAQPISRGNAATFWGPARVAPEMISSSKGTGAVSSTVPPRPNSGSSIQDLVGLEHRRRWPFSAVSSGTPWALALRWRQSPQLRRL
jgi:hypothetical protein